MRLRVEELHFDDMSREKLASHGVSIRAARQVLYERPKYRKNRKNRAATHKMIGPDRGGAMWTIFIRETDYQPGLWRVINGWDTEDEDKDWYRRH